MKKIKKAHDGRLFVLDLKSSSILSFDTDGNDLVTITDQLCGIPNGIAVDPYKEHIYWSSMGEYREGETFPRNDGSIQRINFDGSGHTIVVPKGATFTPTQLQIDLVNNFIYWSDREGMRVMRAKLNGADITTLIATGDGEDDRKDETRHCAGVAIDPVNRYLYWTQKGSSSFNSGRIFRAGIDIPPNSSASRRHDVELIVDELPEPFDLDIDFLAGNLYWTDRGDRPNGNALKRISIVKNNLGPQQVIAVGLEEATGLSVDAENNKIYVTDLDGHIYSTTLDGFNRRDLFSGHRMFTGIAHIPGGLDD